MSACNTLVKGDISSRLFWCWCWALNRKASVCAYVSFSICRTHPWSFWSACNNTALVNQYWVRFVCDEETHCSQQSWSICVNAVGHSHYWHPVFLSLFPYFKCIPYSFFTVYLLKFLSYFSCLIIKMFSSSRAWVLCLLI